MKKLDLASKTKTELLKIAQRLGLRGISTLNKPELVERVEKAQQTRSASPVQKLEAGVSGVAKRLAESVKRRAIRKRELAAAAREVAPRKSPLAAVTTVASGKARSPKRPRSRPPQRSRGNVRSQI